jgi:hypothetical protein
MRGGVDQGFCLSYWRLSYRRKLIRTVWGCVIGALLMAVLLPKLGLSGWQLYGLVTLAVVLGALQVLYNYNRWQSEIISKDST